MNIVLLTPAFLFRCELNNTFSLGQLISKDCMDIYYLQQQQFSQNNSWSGIKKDSTNEISIPSHFEPCNLVSGTYAHSENYEQMNTYIFNTFWKFERK